MTDRITGCSLGMTFVLEKGKVQNFVGLAILDNAKTLKSELELWLTPAAKGAIKADAISGIKGGVKETSTYAELNSKILTARSKIGI